jgi:hypothetical protein
MNTKRWKTELTLIHWYLFICLVWSLTVFGQTSPQGTFKIADPVRVYRLGSASVAMHSSSALAVEWNNAYAANSQEDNQLSRATRNRK